MQHRLHAGIGDGRLRRVESRQDVDRNIGEAVPIEVPANGLDDLLGREVDDHADIERGGRPCRDDEGYRPGPGAQESAAQPGDVEGRAVEKVDQRVHAFQPALDMRNVGDAAQRQCIAPVLPAGATGDPGEQLRFPAAQRLAMPPDTLQFGNFAALAVLVDQRGERFCEAEGRGRDEARHGGMHGPGRAASPGIPACTQLDDDHAFQAEADRNGPGSALRHGGDEARRDGLQAVGIPLDELRVGRAAENLLPLGKEHDVDR